MISDLKRLGLRVPRDISVLGYDGIALGALVEPPLASVVQPNGEIGERAVAQLLQRFGLAATGVSNVSGLSDVSGARPGRITLLPHGLRLGGTVAAPA